MIIWQSLYRRLPQVAGTSDGEGESWWIVEIVDEKQFSGGLWAANYTHVRFRSNVTGHYIVQTGMSRDKTEVNISVRGLQL